MARSGFGLPNTILFYSAQLISCTLLLYHLQNYCSVLRQKVVKSSSQKHLIQKFKDHITFIFKETQECNYTFLSIQYWMQKMGQIICWKQLRSFFCQIPKKSTRTLKFYFYKNQARLVFYQFNSGHMIKAILGSSSIMHIPFNPDIYYYKVSSTI